MTRGGPAPVTRRRSTWSRSALGDLGVSGIPECTNQDLRDAIAAAVTARQRSEKRTEGFGDLVVPLVPLR